MLRGHDGCVRIQILRQFGSSKCGTQTTKDTKTYQRSNGLKDGPTNECGQTERLEADRNKHGNLRPDKESMNEVQGPPQVMVGNCSPQQPQLNSGTYTVWGQVLRKMLSAIE